MSSTYCWREPMKQIPCAKSMCCYRASGKAVFDYWQYANSKEWKDIVKRELALATKGTNSK